LSPSQTIGVGSCLRPLVVRLVDLLDALDGEAEAILVDDGSSDRATT
jgi:hypothetical protein